MRARDELGALVLLPCRGRRARASATSTSRTCFFEERGIPSPPSWLPDDVPDDARFPLLVKAREGFGSRHIYRARDRAELDFFLRYTPVDSFVQTCLPRRGVLDRRLLRPRRPLPERDPAHDDPVEGRRVDQGMTIQDRDLIEFGAEVAEALGLVGPGTIQCFREADGAHEVTDVNPRFGGAFPLPLAAGSRYPSSRWRSRTASGPSRRSASSAQGSLMTRFFSHLCLTAGDGGSLVPFAEELPEPVAGEPGEA